MIATSSYLSYLIGRKQVAYEELRRQVDRVVELMDQKRAEDELAVTAPKQQQEKLEQNESALTGLTTSTINGKTIAVPQSVPQPVLAAPIVTLPTDDTPAAPPNHEVRLQPAEPAPSSAIKHREIRGGAHQRISRRQKVSPTSTVPKRGSTEPAGEQSGQLSSTAATPDVGLGRQ